MPSPFDLGASFSTSVADFLLISAKVALFLWIVVFGMRMAKRVPASIRHFVCSCAIAAACLIPVLALILPSWEVIPSQANPIALIEQMADKTSPEMEYRSVGLEPSRDSAVSVSEGKAPSPRGIVSSIGSLLVEQAIWIWIAGSLWIALRVVAGAIWAARAVRQSARASGPKWSQLLEEYAEGAGLSRAVTIRVHPDNIMPCVVNIRRPVILLPAEAARWSDEQVRAVIFHELSHVARWDLLTMLVATVACAIQWFNPLLWSVRRLMARDQEHACDDIVLKCGIPADVYARNILHVAANAGQADESRAYLIKKRDLERRITSILESKMNAISLNRRRAAVLASLILVLIIPLTVVEYSASAQVVTTAADITGAKTDSIILEELIGALAGEKASDREAAARVLGSMADTRAAPPLVAALNDQNADVREWAARSLGEIGDPATAEPLIQSLQDSDADVREWAARSLGAIGGPAIVKPLIQSLQDSDADVREWAARSLGAIGGPAIVEPLIRSLDDSDADVRQWAVRSLGMIGDPRAIDPLRARLLDSDGDVREWAILTIGSLRTNAGAADEG